MCSDSEGRRIGGEGSEQVQVSCPNPECYMHGKVGEWNIQRNGYEWFCDACGHLFRTEKAASSKLPERAYKVLQKLPNYPSLGMAARKLRIPRSTLSVWLWVGRSHWAAVEEELMIHGCSEPLRSDIRKFAMDTPGRQKVSEGMKEQLRSQVEPGNEMRRGGD